jgi:hypothetical protein
LEFKLYIKQLFIWSLKIWSTINVKLGLNLYVPTSSIFFKCDGFKVDKKMLTASRFSFEYFKEKILDANVIMHLCDNPSCVNPEHLMQGTHKENSVDKVNKKRHVYGEKAWQHILSDQEVLEIKKAQLNYYYGQNNDLAHFYKVNHRTISNIKNGTTWSHIQIS